jgi:hypothetical protein
MYTVVNIETAKSTGGAAITNKILEKFEIKTFPPKYELTWLSRNYNDERIKVTVFPQEKWTNIIFVAIEKPALETTAEFTLQVDSKDRTLEFCNVEITRQGAAKKTYNSEINSDSSDWGIDFKRGVLDYLAERGIDDDLISFIFQSELDEFFPEMHRFVVSSKDQ